MTIEADCRRGRHVAPAFHVHLVLMSKYRHGVLDDAMLSCYETATRKVCADSGAESHRDGAIVNRGRIGVAVLQEEKSVWLDCLHRILTFERAAHIVRDLNAGGTPSPDGGKWTAGNLKRLLTALRYVEFDASGHPAGCPCLVNLEGGGTLVHHGNRHRAVWPAFITGETYQQLLAAFEQAAQLWAHGLLNGRSYLLSALAACGRCGMAMYGSGRKRRDDTYQRRYRCRPYDVYGGRVGCGKVFRDASALDEYVTAAVFGWLHSSAAARVLAAEHDQDRAAALSVQLAGEQARRRQIVAEYGRGEHARADYRVMLAAANAANEAIEAIQTELSGLHARNTAGIRPARGMLEEVWEASSIHWKRKVIRLAAERIEVHPSHSTGRRTWNGHRFNPDDITIRWRE